MPSSDLVQSLSRGLTILEHLAASENGLALAQLCEDLGLKSPTVHNLLRTLAAHGFVEKAAGPTRYRLGPAAARLSDQQRQRSLLRRVEAAMRALTPRFPQVQFSFAEPVGGEVVTTLRVSPEQPGQVQRGLVQTMGPYVTASALLHQALWPAEQREAYRRRYPFAEFGGHAWGSIEEFDGFLSRARLIGYAEPRFPNDGHYRVAAPVFGEGRRFVGVIGAYLPAAYESAAFDPAPLHDAVRQAAAAASAVEPAAA